jgi:hypothetical protein
MFGPQPLLEELRVKKAVRIVLDSKLGLDSMTWQLHIPILYLKPMVGTQKRYMPEQIRNCLGNAHWGIFGKPLEVLVVQTVVGVLIVQTLSVGQVSMIL